MEPAGLSFHLTRSHKTSRKLDIKNRECRKMREARKARTGIERRSIASAWQQYLKTERSPRTLQSPPASHQDQSCHPQ